MIEKTILDYLTENLTVPVYMELPPKPPTTCVVIEKTGSDVRNHIYSAMIALQSYAETLYQAAELNEAVKALMNEAAVLNDVTSSRLNSDYNFTDTATHRYRYQAVYDISHY